MVTRYLVDTSVWVNVLRGDAVTRERMSALTKKGSSIVMCEPVAMELLAGARKHEVLSINEFIDRFASLEFDTLHDFRSAGEIRRQLSWQGKTVKSVVDCMIAVLARPISAVSQERPCVAPKPHAVRPQSRKDTTRQSMVWSGL